MSAIDEVFARCQEQRRAAFIPYLTGGDPDLPRSADLLAALVDGGADIIEVGVPFSDPIADGPVNQRAAMRSLESGTTVAGILDLVARHRSRSEVPVVLFSYFNPILSRGVEGFAEQAADSGVDGVLCVDLPPNEAAREYTPALRQHAIDTVFLLAPTSTRDRVREVAREATGFVYYVSRTGVTGVQERLAAELGRQVKRLRRRLRQPLVVGFGLSSPEQVATVGSITDGVVIGSALVRLVEEKQDRADLPAIIAAEARRLSEPLRAGAPRRRPRA
jgi:tryptophan synthase alpha chain